MNVKVYNQEGAEVGSVALRDDLFGIEPNEALVHQYITNFLARQRQGNADIKVRSEVSGGGKKPWKQKGTGRARAGSTRSPLWRGGGTVFGPTPRSYGSKFPKKMKRLAIASVLSDRAKNERIKVLDKLSLTDFKTKAMAGVLTKLKLDSKRCLILDTANSEQVAISCRNLPNVQYARAEQVNGYDLLHAEMILFTKAGLSKVEEVFS